MFTGVSSPTGAAEAGGGLDQPLRPTWRDHRGWRWLAVAAGVLLLFYCALREARQLAPQSDGAAMVLESWAMLHGDLLLRGWQLSDVSFYTTELPEYMLVELVRGFHPDVVRICSALTFTLLVVLAAAVAYGSRPADKRTAVVRAGITVAVMIGPTVLAATVLLNDPDHTGTAVPVLLALLILDRGRRRWWVPVAVAAVLGWALVGDSLVLLIGVAPLVVVCGARSFGLLAVRREPFSAARYDLSLAAAGLAAAVGGTALSALIKANGGFVLSASETKSTVPSTALPANLAATLNDFLGLFSADFFASRLDDWLAVTAVHLICACLVAGALFLALRAFGRDFLGGDLIAQLLAVAIVINVLAYVVLYPGSGSTVREIAPVFGLGGALAGRVLAEPLLRRRLEPALALGAVAVVVAAVPPLVIAKARPRRGRPGPVPGGSRPDPRAGRLLERRQHDAGHPGPGGHRAGQVPPGAGLEPLLWETQPRLFDSADNDPNFLVATAPGGPSSVTPAEAVAAFGQPSGGTPTTATRSWCGRRICSASCRAPRRAD